MEIISSPFDRETELNSKLGAMIECLSAGEYLIRFSTIQSLANKHSNSNAAHPAANILV